MNVKNEGNYIFYSILTGSHTKIMGKKQTQVPIPLARGNSFPHWEFISEFQTAVRDGAVILKSSHRMGTGGLKKKSPRISL
jgi:hypothetical protein